jgi:pathogenesis-related protein 1
MTEGEMQTRFGKIADWAAVLFLLGTGGGVSGSAVWYRASGIIAEQNAQLRYANDVIAAQNAEVVKAIDKLEQTDAAIAAAADAVAAAKARLDAAEKREQALQVRLDRTEAARDATKPLEAGLKELVKQVEAALAVKPVSPPPALLKVKPTPVPPKAKPATLAPLKVKPTVVADPAAVASIPAPVGRVDPAAMVAAHNRWRGEVGVPGLKWSEKLEGIAQQWADHLAASNCTTEHSGPGENIYKAGAMAWPDGRREVWAVTSQQVVDFWGNESNQWDNATGRCSGVCGHYTQVVWKGSTEVGCGMAVCGNKAQIWVCNYSPAGNVVGQKPY